MARRNAYRGKYKLSKEEYLSAKYYALRYNEWMDEYNKLKDSVAAIQYGDNPHTSGTESITERLAIRRDELRKKMEIIEKAAKEADPELYPYILTAATNDFISFHMLKTTMNIPCEQDMYYDRRRKFYWILSKKI